jgi:hypothetical protein
MARYSYIAALALLAGSPALAQSEKANTPDPKDKVICKKFMETGSLVKGYRTCKTRSQWQLERDAQREKGEKMTSHITTERGS